MEIEGLRKTYRRRAGTVVAVDSLDLVVPEGGVYGFLGPNGSGKTTTIRCLLGLARPTNGDLTLLGRPIPAGLRDAVVRTGAIVETPALFPTMNARENLRLLGSVDGIGRTRVDELLDLVGLGDRAGDLVKRYSLGMKQRLALAAALLKDPELLILDEPANGLDPAGMREVRQLLRRLADEGRTVFVSSHILAEIESTCDRVAILARGRCVSHGSVEDVLERAGHRSSIAVKVADLDAGERALRAAQLGVERVDGSLRVDVPPESAGEVTRVLAQADQWVTELRPVRFSLEDVFLELTGDSPTEAAEHAVDAPTFEEVVA
ncbi:MAG: ABC transporter ATP-binding protein [Ilumatobacter sp.]|nr:ABC transporter ATP-binding protein [Ilumatobacter sp.]